MKKTDYDLVIIGGGAAGLTAGIYASRARLNTVLIEKSAPGGQILLTDWIENYPGFPEGLAGHALVQQMTDENMGTTVPGVFAAGYVRHTPLRQVATAVGDAAVAAISAERYIESITEKDHC